MVTHQLQVERRTETDVLPLCHAATYLRHYTCDIHQLFAQVTYGRGAVLLWRRCDTLCTSGFVDDVMFAHKPRLLDVATPAEAQCTRSLGPGYKLHSGSNTSCGPDDAWDYFSQLD